jgi:hypothetical protein
VSAPLAIVQNAYVVADLDEACARFNRLFGLGPFVGGSEGVLADHVYRGEPAEPIRIRGVFVQSGELNIELIQVLSDAPSAFHDMFGGERREGLHHSALFAPDYEATKRSFVNQGHTVASEFWFQGRRICYVDTRPSLGHMIEIYPDLPLIRAMYAQARDAARERPGELALRPWAGRD